MQAWQWDIKKSNTLRVGFLIVGVAGFEPATSCSQSRRAMHPKPCVDADSQIAIPEFACNLTEKAGFDLCY